MSETPTAPYKLAEKGQYVCPGSMFIRSGDGRCICGHPREAHVWENRNGVVYQVDARLRAERDSAERTP